MLLILDNTPIERRPVARQLFDDDEAGTTPAADEGPVMMQVDRQDKRMWSVSF